MSKPTKTDKELVELVLDRTYQRLGLQRPPRYPIGLQFRAQKEAPPGEANWDIQCGLEGHPFLRAFAAAAAETKAEFDLSFPV